jgi:GWxTD domain-containing protein
MSFGKGFAFSLVLLCVSPGNRVLHAQAEDQQRSQRLKEKPLRMLAEVPSRKWLNEDVVYIITDEERSDFKKLTTDQQRDKFITDFWARRNPNPGSLENKFQEEHYRRIAYANEHFAADIQGWRTDRGRTYIMFGPPDRVDKHFSAAGSEDAIDFVGVGSIPYDWELWHYRSIEGVGEDIDLKFVDTCGCGRFQIPIPKGDFNH